MSFSFAGNKRYHQTLDKDLFLQAFLKNVCLRPSCHSCAFKSLHRLSDMTLGDFWGVQNVLPDFDDDKGVSLIFVNSASGNAMFDRIGENMRYREVDINRAVVANTAATRSAKLHAKREAFFKNLEILPFDHLVRRYCLPSLFEQIRSKARKVGHQLKKKMRL